MTSNPTVVTGSVETQYRCACGWEGPESELVDWDVQTDRDRVVRVCPGCESSVPEWGCLRPIDGVRRVAEGNLQRALTNHE